MKKIGLLLFLALLGMSMPIQSTFAQEETVDYGQVKEYEIGGITVQGTRFLDENILISLSGLAVGDRISIPGEEIPKAIKTLWKQGLFSDVQIYASNIVNNIIFLDLRLTELPRLTKYRFEGVRNSEVDELREILPLLAGRILDENTKNNTTTETKAFFARKGYYNVEVDLTQKVDSIRPNSVVLTIIVNRGKKIKVNQIIFNGIENVYPRKLKKAMANTKEKSRIDPKAPKIVWDDMKKAKLIPTLANVSISDLLNYMDDKLRIRLFSSSKFLKDDYKMDKETLIAYYNTQGFRDARIISDTVYYESGQNLNIEMNIEEGPRYYFRNFTWTGNSKYDEDELSKVLNIPKGESFNPDLLQTRLFADPTGNDVSSLYMNDGYLFFNVTPIETRIENDSIDYELRMYEGPEATINNIIIKGNTKTNEHVIRRSLWTKPGSKFRRSDIIQSQRELSGLGFFNAENIGIRPIPNPADGTVDIEYTVEERPSDQLELSAGWGGNTVVGSLGVSFNNFSVKNMFNREAWRQRGLPSGDGQKLAVRFQATGPAFQALTASFTEPWLGGRRPNSLTVSYTRARQARYPSNFGIFDYTKDPLNLLVNNAVSVSLGRRLRWPDPHFTLINSVNFSHFLLENWNDRFIVTNGSYYNITLGTVISRSTVNQPIYPRQGSNFSLSIEVTPPYSSLNNKDYSKLSDPEKYRFPEYHKWKFKGEWFTPITRDQKMVLRAYAKTGVLGYYNEEIGTAPFERFWIGGDGLANQIGGFLAGTDILALRGYEEDEITNNIYVREDGNAVPVGDPYFAKAGLELRYLLSPSPTATIYAHAFVEGGNSWSNFQEYDPFQLNRSAGLGLRIFLPMFGLMGFDYGIGFDKNTANWAQGDGFGTYLGQYGKFSFILGFEPE